MASFCYRIRSTQKNKLVKIQILFTVGRGNQFYADCQYMVLTDAWDNKRQTVKSRFRHGQLGPGDLVDHWPTRSPADDLD